MNLAKTDVTTMRLSFTRKPSGDMTMVMGRTLTIDSVNGPAGPAQDRTKIVYDKQQAH